MVGEVVGACGASLGGPCGAAKAHCCVAVDESRSSLAARCVSFYQIVCLSVCLSADRMPLFGGLSRAEISFSGPEILVTPL
eukprot:scaffold34554_cov27-Phaeocystis_antarctica.AAC.2